MIEKHIRAEAIKWARLGIKKETIAKKLKISKTSVYSILREAGMLNSDRQKMLGKARRDIDNSEK